ADQGGRAGPRRGEHRPRRRRAKEDGELSVRPQRLLLPLLQLQLIGEKGNRYLISAPSPSVSADGAGVARVHQEAETEGDHAGDKGHGERPIGGEATASGLGRSLPGRV